MRKFLPYIFIVLVLSGIFAPATNVYAQEAKGVCKWTDDRGVFHTEPDKTVGECKTLLQGKAGTWVVVANDGSVNELIIEASTPSPITGTCYNPVDGTLIAADVTQHKCPESPTQS